MKYVLSLFVFCLGFAAVAQQPGENSPRNITVSGKIVHATTNEPLVYATVSFTNTEGKIVNGGITNENGVFNLEIPVGTYTVTYEYIGFETKMLSNQNLTTDTTLPNASLAENAESLDDVIIRAETTQVEVRLDKKIYNIGKDLTTSGSTVSDALANVPSVTVDVEGAIALRGNENVRILINGKPSAIAGFGSTDALRSLPAEAIDRVEVITSPSARYDAEGTAGILNIILRKEKTLGFNGSIQANMGFPLSSSTNANINLRTDKFNIFNTTGVRYRTSPGNAFFENRFLSPSVINPFVIEDREYSRKSENFNTNLGMEYFLSDKTSITGSIFLRTGEDEDETENRTSEFDPNNDLAVRRLRSEFETEDEESYQFSLNYITKFDDNGHKLTADLQYENDDESETSLIDEQNNFPQTEILPSEFITTDEIQNEYLAQIDYVRPIGENAQFEAGYRGNFEETETNYVLTEQLATGGDFIRNDSLSNIFTYTENVNAVYTQYGTKFGKFSFLAGLRFENTQLKGDVDAENVNNSGDDNLNIDFENNYAGLFPTLNLTYELGDRENITLGYNRRINRPRGYFINPFPSRSSEANVFQGNPNLNPAFSNAFDLGYLKRWDELTLTSSIYYNRETDSFERIQEDTGEVTPNGIPIIRTLPINLSTNERIGFELGLLYNPAKWLRLNGSFNFFQFKTEGDFNGIDYSADNTSYFARGSAKVSLPFKIDWQTNVFYRGPRNNAQTETEGLLSTNLAFSKDFIDDKATIGFNVSDVFNSRKRVSRTETNTFISESEFQYRQRSFNLSFTYRFNQQKNERRRQDQGQNDGGEGEGFEG